MLPRMQIVGIGEVLWDVFPDGPRFGGAPANFACSAASVGGDRVHVSIVSSVGADELGDQARNELRLRNVDVSQLTALSYPTGQVFVELDQLGQPCYRFLEKTAWDFVEWTSGLSQLASRADAVCFGTLGQRGSVSQSTIRRFIAAARADCLRVLDINLRTPYWDQRTIRESLPLANVLKVNSDELPIVADVFHLSGDEDRLLREILTLFSLQAIALTRGAAGSLVLSANGERSELPGRRMDIVDTVGAGDAFTATFVLGMLLKLPFSESHLWADEVAAYVCTQAGATPVFPAGLRKHFT